MNTDCIKCNTKRERLISTIIVGTGINQKFLSQSHFIKMYNYMPEINISGIDLLFRHT